MIDDGSTPGRPEDTDFDGRLLGLAAAQRRPSAVDPIARQNLNPIGVPLHA
jgi:hypothetical protein